MQKQSICKECKNYIQHYAKRANMTMWAIGCGHCGQYPIRSVERTQCRHFIKCNLEEEKKSQSKKLRDLLEGMHDKLDALLEAIHAE